MDAGPVVAWPARYEPNTEASAVQHTMNLKLRDGEAFAAECQNEPAAEQFADERLTADQVAEKTTSRLRGRGEHARRPLARPGRQTGAATEALHAGRLEEAITMEGASPERKSWSPTNDQRGLECRHCGCKHFRVIYTRPTWGARIMRRRECRHCGKRMTTWERAKG